MKEGGGAQWATLDTSKSIQFYQTNVTNVAKILLLQVFLDIRHKLFDFQTFMNQTHIINFTEIVIYLTDLLQISAFFLFSNFRKRQIALYSPCWLVGRSVGRRHH